MPENHLLALSVRLLRYVSATALLPAGVIVNHVGMMAITGVHGAPPFAFSVFGFVLGLCAVGLFAGAYQLVRDLPGSWYWRFATQAVLGLYTVFTAFAFMLMLLTAFSPEEDVGFWVPLLILLVGVAQVRTLWWLHRANQERHEVEAEQRRFEFARLKDLARERREKRLRT